MASFYDRVILPRLLCAACASPPMMRQRSKVVPLASGKVLELGIGGGLNLMSYDPARATSVTGVDPHAELRERAMAAPRPEGLAVEVLEGTAEALPFPDASFDSIVCTFTLCSVQDPGRCLAEAKRVLKPGGAFLFCEHGLAPDPEVVKWQRRLEPIWKMIAGGCHLTRPVAKGVVSGGFTAEWVDQMYVPGTPRFAGWNEWGLARP